MAYSLTDYYRPLRIVMRLNGITLGIGLGVTLLLRPSTILVTWGEALNGPTWVVRLAGASLITLGILFLIEANERVMHPSVLVALFISHTLFALIILVAYLQQEFAGLPTWGRIVLILVFLLCLSGAITPLRYLRDERRL